MPTKLLTLLAVVAAAHAARPNYSFGYAVSDSRNDFGHQETRQLENTEGAYHVALPDGRLQQVAYRIDGDSGYLVDVSYKGKARFPDSDESFESYEFRGPRYSSESFESGERRVFNVPKIHTFQKPSVSRSFFRPSGSRSSSSFFRFPDSRVASSDSSFFHRGSKDSSEFPLTLLESSERRVFGAPKSRRYPRPSRVFSRFSGESLEFPFGSDESHDHRFNSGESVEYFRVPKNPFIKAHSRYGHYY